MQWVTITDNNSLPDKAGKYIIETHIMMNTTNRFESRMTISDKGNKSFDISNQKAVKWLKEN